jgi:hypothetical protein
MKSTTNVFLASLASADLLLIIICIPVKVSWSDLFIYRVNISGYVWLNESDKNGIVRSESHSSPQFRDALK